MSAPPPLLQLRGIVKSFRGVEVLHGVDLDAAGGEVTVLLGENGAGKSTLVKVIAGAHRPDQGQVVIDGETYAGFDPVQARALGISVVFQELAYAPDLTVAENIALGRLPGRNGIVHWRQLRQNADRVLKSLGVHIDVDAPLRRLRLGERQIVEIARAVAAGGRVLVLDEPTATLSTGEIAQLFGLIRRLRGQGVAIIYITHRLNEVWEIGDRVQVLRDGKVALYKPIEEVQRDEIVAAMVGAGVGAVTRPTDRQYQSEKVVAEFRGASASRGAFNDVDLTVQAGEVHALYGKLGSGCEELAEAAFGIQELSGGQFLLDGTARRLRNPRQAISAGVGLLPADRARAGMLTGRSVAENLSAPSWSRLGKAKTFINSPMEHATYRRWHDVLRVRSRNDPDQSINTLSGGNQQKVLLGRWLERQSHLLVLIEPTRGVDVGARQEIYRSIRDLAKSGAAVLIATSDYEEVIQVADRVSVMARGRLIESLSGNDIAADRLAHALGG